MKTTPSRSRTGKCAISLERIEEMLLFAAQMVDELGPVAQPWVDRLEAEYVAAKKRGKEEDRIRALIAAERATFQDTI